MPNETRLWRDEGCSPVKRYLMEYRVLAQRRDALAEELDRLREATTRATARLNPVRPSGKPNYAGNESGMLRVVDAEEKLTLLIDHAGEALAVRLALIERIPDERQKTLLTLRYINGLGWEQIGYRMHYERTQVFEIHARALRAATEELEIMKATDARKAAEATQAGDHAGF